MRILHALLAGAPTQTSWSQAYVKKDDDSFFGVVIHVSVPITEREHVGKSILDACMNASQDGMTRDVFLNLFKQWGSEGIHIASVCVSHDKMTLFAQGQTNIWLERGGKGDTVLKGKAQGVYIEGNVFQGDYYCISTSAYAYPKTIKYHVKKRTDWNDTGKNEKKPKRFVTTGKKKRIIVRSIHPVLTIKCSRRKSRMCSFVCCTSKNMFCGMRENAVSGLVLGCAFWRTLLCAMTSCTLRGVPCPFEVTAGEAGEGGATKTSGIRLIISSFLPQHPSFR